MQYLELDGAKYTRNEFPLNLQPFIDVCSSSGDVSNVCKYWSTFFYAPKKKTKQFLKEYGCWNDNELQDHKENMIKVIWILANNIKDDEITR